MSEPNPPPIEMKATDMYYITMFHKAIIDFGEGQGGTIESLYKEAMRKVPKDVFMRGLVNHLANENRELPDGNPELRRS
jgi:hypothetical protein